MFSSQFWISGLERSWFRMLVEAKKNRRTDEIYCSHFFYRDEEKDDARL